MKEGVRQIAVAVRQEGAVVNGAKAGLGQRRGKPTWLAMVGVFPMRVRGCVNNLH